MDFPRTSPRSDPAKLNSFSSLFFYRKEPQRKKPPMRHLPASSSLLLLDPPGLKTLTSPLNPDRYLSRIKLNLFSFSSLSLSPHSPSSHSSSSSSSSSFATDDVKCHKKERDGIENGEAEREKEIAHEKSCPVRIYQNQLLCHRRRRTSTRDETREFPPPIPLLARTGNQPCHMPWVLKRIRENGRLVIQEVKVKHHEFFRAHRGNGRLTLQLIHFDESALSPHQLHHLKHEQDNENENGNTPVNQVDDDVVEEEEIKETQTEIAIAKDKLHQQPSLPSHKEKSIEERNPSSPPSPSPYQSLSPPLSISGPHLIKHKATANVDNRPLPEKSSLWEQKKENMNMPDVLGMLSPASLPESSFAMNGGGCSASRRSDSLFQTPVPTIRPILS